MFKTQYNNSKFEKKFEQGSKVSLTVPDMQMSIRTLLKNHTRNSLLDIQKSAEWGDNDSLDEIDPSRLGDFDLVDLQNMQLELDEKTKAVNTAIKELQANKNAEEKAKQSEANNEAKKTPESSLKNSKE